MTVTFEGIGAWPGVLARLTAGGDLSAEEALHLAQQLPPPIFDADRRLRELDELDRRME